VESLRDLVSTRGQLMSTLEIFIGTTEISQALEGSSTHTVPSHAPEPCVFRSTAETSYFKKKKKNKRMVW
jgi:hypothetical protein